MELSYDADGLIPVIVQDSLSGEVLILAYANEEAVELTIGSGELHLWSRSRQQLWLKGESSGNTLRLAGLRLDCDADALLALVEAAGPACHTGERSCFFTEMKGGAAPHEALPSIERTLVDRARERPEGSYSVELLDNPQLASAKLSEEAEEVGRACREESDSRVDEEAADLLYHLAALIHSRGRNLADAQRVLLERRR